MDLTTVALPQSERHLDALLAAAARALPGKPLSDSDRQEVSSLASIIREGDLDRVSEAGVTALRADADFYGPSESLQTDLRPVLDRHGLALLAVLTESDPLTFTGDAGGHAPQFISIAGSALEVTRELWGTSAGELEKLLTRRAEVLARARQRAAHSRRGARSRGVPGLAHRAQHHAPAAEAVTVAASLVGEDVRARNAAGSTRAAARSCARRTRSAASRNRFADWWDA
jgi:hypothetical protein